MVLWSTEIKEIEVIHTSLKGKLPDLEKELERLIKTDDENIVLIYSRRCLEVIVNDLCESELKRPRKTEPLKGIIDKLGHEDKVPAHIIASMLNLNSLSTFGAHPKEFDPRQVKPVLNNLSTILEWYLKYKGIDVVVSDTKEEVKEESKEVVPEESKRVEPSSQKSSVVFRKKSKIIFGILLIICIVLLLVFDVFNFFSKDKFKEIRDPDGRISIAVMPFQNLTGDSSLNFWQSGISEFLINDLGTSEELSVFSSRIISEVLETNGQIKTLSVSPAVARDVAQKIRAGTHITGNFMGTGDDVSIMVNLVNTENGELIWSNRIDGTLKSGEYRHLLDSLSDLVRNFLEIKALEQQANEDFLNAFPNSAVAYQYYIDGLNAIIASDYESAIESLQKAFNIDTTFTFAAFYLAWAYNVSRRFEEQNVWIQKTFELKDNLPSKYHPWVNLWHACFITKDGDDIARYLKLMEETQMKSRFYLFDIGSTYAVFLENYTKALNAYEKVAALNQEWGENWKYDLYYELYSYALLMADRPDEAFKICEKGLQINPENGWLDVYQGSSYVMQGDTLATQNSISKIRSVVKKYNGTESLEEYAIGEMYFYGKDTVKALEHYRKAYNLDPENPARISNLAIRLIRSGINIKEGLALAEKGLEKEPEGTRFRWQKGLALHKLGRNEEALALLKEVDEILLGYNMWLENDIKEVEQAIANQRK